MGPRLKSGRRRGWPLWAWLLASVGVVFTLALLGWALVVVPPLLVSKPGLAPKDLADAEATTRTGLIAALAGLAALGTLTVNSQTYRATEQRNITDRYTKAVEQIGSERLDIRLGGIYALERLAVDSKRDHTVVVEVLSAFTRERTAASGDGRRSAHAAIDDLPSTDVQAALTVLGRLPDKPVFRRADLSGASLKGANLGWCDLRYSSLAGVDLSEAVLTKVDLGGADLRGAALIGADLRMANLVAAHLHSVDLTGADLSESKLGLASFGNSVLTDCDFTEADLSNADLSGVKGLVEGQLTLAKGDRGTKLPVGYIGPKHWTQGPDLRT